MTIATTNENTYARAFLKMAALLPKYLISTGIVTIPTIIKVEINTANCVRPAPLFRSAAASGKATKPGIKVMEPIKEAKTIPSHPDCPPISVDIISGFDSASVMPIIIKIERN